ncbi:MAG: hypothetical protein M3346_02780, partial [Actinomycetota bacterium]|nr:hypothetical protein [Actinomycetota bacterium]
MATSIFTCGVSNEDFREALDALRSLFIEYRPEMWTAEFATFVVPNEKVETGVALTAVGGEHDQRFVMAWE